MKDFVIQGKVVRRELYLLLGCLVAAELVNTAAILHWGRPVLELLTQLGYVVVLALLFYIVLLLVRGLVWIIYKIFKIK
ncbi:MAG: hypothetical protein IJ721_05565 [Bacteroidales bacterium]|nr:hypothetical protein [Bacteroidales bacterium]